MLYLQIKVAIYDWDIVWKSTFLGSSILDILDEGQTEAVWHALDSASGQVRTQLQRMLLIAASYFSYSRLTLLNAIFLS